jgi:cell division protein FtsA
MRKYFTAESTAKAVLTNAEMENGVALIDFGGGSTSVSIYHGNVMRHYASIPFGGRNITQDIKSECQISEKLAENIKLAFGACMPDKLQSLSDKIIHIKSNSAEPDKQLPVKYLSEIITARIEEIMMAVLYEIEKSGFADMLRSGIVITGGFAKTANLGNFIYDISGFKVRTGYPRKLFSCLDCDGISEPTSATSVGLILNALSDQTVNCAVELPGTRRFITEVETPNGKGIEVTIGVEEDELEENENENGGTGEAGTEEQPQGTIWKDEEIEKVEIKKEKKKKEKKGPGFFTVTFTKIKEGLFDLYQDIAEDEPTEKA